MALNVCYSNDQPNHVIRPFENQTKKCPKSQMFVFQMVTVFRSSLCKLFFSDSDDVKVNLKIREDNLKLDNVPYNDSISALEYRKANRQARKTCTPDK